MTNNPHVLLTAFHFPPFQRSSGIQRTLNFARDLGAHGWQRTVLSAHPLAYRVRGDEQLADIPDDVRVLRPLAFDAARHFALLGRYPRTLARPDPWGSWRWRGVPAAVQAVREHGVDVLWSTFPIATAHQIAATVQQRTGLPWIADFRDVMTDQDYPSDPVQFADFRALEVRAAQQAARLVFTTPGAIRLYRERFPEVPEHRFVLIENGFDEAAFAGLTPTPAAGLAPPQRPVRLLHSGIVYPSERDPTALFRALRRLLDDQLIGTGDLRIVLRATANDDQFMPMINALGLQDIVELAPGLPYRDALQEMLCADGLLVLQGANCNAQIPAKVYEYLRAGRPILGLADPQGDTGALLRVAGVAHVCALEDESAICQVLPDYLAALQSWQPPQDLAAFAADFSRRHRSAQLAEVLAEVLQEHTG